MSSSSTCLKYSKWNPYWCVQRADSAEAVAADVPSGVCQSGCQYVADDADGTNARCVVDSSQYELKVPPASRCGAGTQLDTSSMKCVSLMEGSLSHYVAKSVQALVCDSSPAQLPSALHTEWCGGTAAEKQAAFQSAHTNLYAATTDAARSVVAQVCLDYQNNGSGCPVDAAADGTPAMCVVNANNFCVPNQDYLDGLNVTYPLQSVQGRPVTFSSSICLPSESSVAESAATTSDGTASGASEATDDGTATTDTTDNGTVTTATDNGTAVVASDGSTINSTATNPGNGTTMTTGNGAANNANANAWRW